MKTMQHGDNTPMGGHYRRLRQELATEVKLVRSWW